MQKNAADLAYSTRILKECYELLATVVLSTHNESSQYGASSAAVRQSLLNASQCLGTFDQQLRENYEKAVLNGILP